MIDVHVNFLQYVWFVLICVLWVGYFVLEGFDFGVGALVRAVAKTDSEKRAVIHTIGPVWDGNEVWLLVAGGATFAAFPQWYATLFSGFYLALFLILCFLIIRGVSFEFWGHRDDPTWRTRWEWVMIIGSALPALLWGVGWANIVRGVPIDRTGEFTGTLFTLLNPYALLGGLTTLAIFLAHGAHFLTLRTKGDITDRARDLAQKLTPAAVGLTAVFVIWTLINQSNHGGIEPLSAVLGAASVVAFGVGSLFARDRNAAAFVAMCAGIALLFCCLFVDLFPYAMVSTTDPAYSLSLPAAASSHYTLTVMTVVAVLLVPIVLLYQGWSYWVFRARLGAEDFEGVRTPIDLIERRTQSD